MVEKVITKVLRKRHYWRHIDFSELAELYASRVLRVMAISMVSGFIAVFLYQLGYSLTFIAGYFALQFGLRGLLSVPSAYVIGRVGPKHSILIANMTYVPALVALSSIEANGVIALAFCLVFQAMSASLYNIAYQTDFSKIKHSHHAGKEIGYMVALERVTMAGSPIIGGFIAFLFGPQTTIIVAAGIFALAAWPLLLTSEPVRLHQRIRFSGLRSAKIRRGLVANFGIGWDFAASGIAWSLFMSITVFGTADNSVYAKIGVVSALSTIAAIVTARLYGVLIDKKHGRKLLNAGAVGASVINLARTGVSTALGVVLINVANESSKTAYAMPFTKGAFDLADDLVGYRIAYMAILDMAISFGAASALLCLCLLSMVFGDASSLQLLFVLSAGVVLLITVQRFRALETL